MAPRRDFVKIHAATVKGMTTPAPVMYATRPSLVARVLGALRLSSVAAYEDNCFGIAKGAAYRRSCLFFPWADDVTALLVQATRSRLRKK